MQAVEGLMKPIVGGLMTCADVFDGCQHNLQKIRKFVASTKIACTTCLMVSEDYARPTQYVASRTQNSEPIIPFHTDRNSPSTTVELDEHV